MSRGHVYKCRNIMYAIICLGNPGREYANTRHNAGFRVGEALALRNKIDISRHRLRCQYGKGRIAGEDVIIAMPMTYMNLSGDAARRLVDFFKIPIENVIAVYDEAALPLGTLRLRAGGSDAGHNGMKSLVQYLGTQDIMRVRLGVGGAPANWELKDWVLSEFSRNELETVEDMVFKACDAIETVINDGLPRAMTFYNK